MPHSDNTPPDELSKSQIKKEMLALQDIGKKLISLSASQLANVPLPDVLFKAIQFAHTLKTHESKRRHLQYIGKLMRHVEVEPIMHALKKIQYLHEQNTTAFHEIETLRDDLIKKGDSVLQLIVEKYPASDRQYLRQLMRKAQTDLKTGKNSGAATEIFRYLRDLDQG